MNCFLRSWLPALYERGASNADLRCTNKVLYAAPVRAAVACSAGEKSPVFTPSGSRSYNVSLSDSQGPIVRIRRCWTSRKGESAALISLARAGSGQMIRRIVSQSGSQRGRMSQEFLGEGNVVTI